MTEPLTDQQLTEIEDAIPLGYDAPWNVVPAEEGGNWLVGYNTDNPDAGLVATVPDYGFYLADFIARARTDMPALLADNARLRAELEQARSQVRAVELARCWTNEDGKRFVFAEDLLAAVQLTAPACSCHAERVHQAGCDTTT